MVEHLNRSEIIRMYMGGASSGQIAKKYGVIRQKIIYILKTAHVARRTRKEASRLYTLTKPELLDLNKVIQIYMGGASLGQTAKELGASKTYIHNLLNRNNIECRTIKEEAIKRNQDSLHAKVNRGEIDQKEYRNCLAKNLGFKSHNDYASNWQHIKGKMRPMEEAKETGIYLGVYIAERILSKIFENVKRMPNNNIGYDFICMKGHKIDVKCSCLRIEAGKSLWRFCINKNTVADYFLLLAFDSRSRLEPQHIWLISSNERIPYLRRLNLSCPLNKRTHLRVLNTQDSLNIYKPFEQINKLEKLKECCNTLR